MPILNDRELYNWRYRKPVLDELAARSQKFDSVGLLDSPTRLPRLIAHCLGRRQGIILSSNLKSNIFTLLFARRQKVVILNGMGRYRSNPHAGMILRFLLGLRRNTFIIVQNYADFRYFSRHCPQLDMEWMPGSGGDQQRIGPSSVPVLVQRDAKVGLVSRNVVKFLCGVMPQPELVIVGCKDKLQLEQLFSEIGWWSVGNVVTADIFFEGGIFVQPSGYGEGFPHTLADAFVSGMEVWISDIEFLRYGLARLGAKRDRLTFGWSRVQSSHLKTGALRSNVIATRICDICETFNE